MPLAKSYATTVLVMNVNRKDRSFVIRFIAFGIVMAIANIIPYVLTRGAYATDGHEIAGFPLRCYDVGGFSGLMYFNPWAMMANMIIAILVAGFAGWLFQDGILNTLRRWQTWGTPIDR